MEVVGNDTLRTRRELDSEGFELIQNKRKKKSSAKPPSINPTKVQNAFASLSDTTPDTPSGSTTTQPKTPLTSSKKDLPPPIVLSRITYPLPEISRHLKSHHINDFRLRPVREDVKILADNHQAHSDIISLLNSQNIPYHTYAPRGTKRNLKFLITGLDDLTTVETVASALAHPDLVSVVRMMATDENGVKTALHPFIATFKPHYKASEHLKKLKHIDNMWFRFQEFSDKQLVAQCHRCQQFGHTRTYCHLPPRCVRCAGEHDSRACARQGNPHCANCGGDHPASYRQCEVRLRREQAVLARRKDPESYIPAPPPTTNAWHSRPLPQAPAPQPAPRQAPRPQRAAVPAPTHDHFPSLTNTTPAEQPPQPYTSSPVDTSAPKWAQELQATMTGLMHTMQLLIQTLNNKFQNH